MKSTDAESPDHSSTLHEVARAAVLPASFSALERTHSNPVGFVSALAHEIRNPLCNITLALELLNLTQLDEEQRQYAGVIMRGYARIKDLVSRLLTLDLAKEVNYEIYSLHDLLEDVLLVVKDRMQLKNITVTRDYAAKEQMVFMDPEKVKIAVANIVINAIEA